MLLALSVLLGLLWGGPALADEVYSAVMVSVSDASKVTNGQQVVIYTSVWNGDKGVNELYLLDVDGTLVPLIRCYDTGYSVSWNIRNVEAALWTFLEYRDGEGNLTYQYDLRNVSTGEYLTPGGWNLVSDSPVGLRLDGRRYGEYGTTIMVWDEVR